MALTRYLDNFLIKQSMVSENALIFETRFTRETVQTQNAY